MDPSSFIDVHVFDGSWSHNITTKFNLEEKNVIFDWLIKQIGENVDYNAIGGLKLVIGDTQQYPNFDPRNNIYADDILAEICVMLVEMNENDRNDVLKNILEQMSDMYLLGRCPQGRSTRLIQIYKSL